MEAETTTRIQHGKGLVLQHMHPGDTDKAQVVGREASRAAVQYLNSRMVAEVAMLHDAGLVRGDLTEECFAMSDNGQVLLNSVTRCIGENSERKPR